MEDQIGTVLHWSHQKEPKQGKSEDEVIRRNLDRIKISTLSDAWCGSQNYIIFRLKKIFLKKVHLAVPGYV